jgi:hypothetical protein
MHLNAPQGDWRARLPKLKQWEFEQCRRGNATICARSKWHTACPSVFMRIDADAHHGQTDGADLIAWVVAMPEFMGKLYSEPSPRGYSGYATVILPKYAMRDGTIGVGKEDIFKR